jgi:hypothetical protein
MPTSERCLITASTAFAVKNDGAFRLKASALVEPAAGHGFSPGGQIPARKSKFVKAHENKIASVCFLLLFRIQTFQWVTTENTK